MSVLSIPTPAGGDGSGVWKWLSGILAGVVLTLIGCMWTQNREVATKQDVIAALATQQKQIDDDTAHVTRIDASLQEMNRSIGEIKGTLKLRAD